MLKVAVIGYGAIAQYVVKALPSIHAELCLVIARPASFTAAQKALNTGVKIVEQLADERPDVVVDCAGHAALKQHGVALLSAGLPLLTVSIGALADPKLHEQLTEAARAGGTKLLLASGAIGGLDALASAKHGDLKSVTYIGRKPPAAWKGSHADEVLDLDQMGDQVVTHFSGTAREAALLYPKNANVAAAVALAGLGFDQTNVELIADPNAAANIHEIRALGDFGEMHFSIQGQSLPSNNRSSALAAMSVLKMLSDQTAAITF